jgi:hypothetical protein
MKTINNIEGFACFTERLDIAVSPYSEKNGILILESDPEPGYFSKNGFPENLARTNDHHLYILTKHPVACFQDWVIQQACLAKNRYDIPVHVSPGQLTFKNIAHNTIRMRTQEVESIKPFVELLQNKGVRFVKHTHAKPFKSVVHFKKHIEMETIAPGVWKDLHDKNRHFIELPRLVEEYEVFEQLIEDIKNNCSFNMFNAAKIVMPRRERVINLIAVYSKHCDENRLPEFKEHVDKLINAGQY